ncbi:MAG TPA: peroxiredoxin [Thermoanaerobaculia bacterium]|nr:peroxiredoxin [Thermoanaerobaculia bacterium]HUM28706.1 peroxiredoxin [Thermoanaerobaculia bacterium]HXK68045.1 peroxiredoxin [Thermoanaerobaculia bacterium]
MDHPQEQPPVTQPRLGNPAPAFEARTTQGTLRLEDFRGSWLVFFSHPADFTPVCTTEFIAFAAIHPALRSMNCELLGLSIDSIYSHIAWIRNIREKTGVEISFPIVADQDGTIARRYGMIQPGDSGTETSRCLFVIDDKGVLRAMIYYPLTTGRNMEEVRRLVQALQTSDLHGVATPADWKPGDRVIVPPPLTQEDADRRRESSELECIDWYYCKQSLPD